MQAFSLEKLNNILTELIVLSSVVDNTFENYLNAYVQFGLKHTGFETGIVSQIKGKEYTVLEVVSSNKDLTKGMIFDLEDTFCRETIKTNKTLFCANTLDSEYKDIPARAAMDIKSVVCTPLIINKQIFGTLNFSTFKQIKDDEAWKFLVRLVEILGQSLSKKIESNLSKEKLGDKSKKLESLNNVLHQFIEEINNTTIKDEGDRLQRFIELLLDFTKFENGFISKINKQEYVILQSATINDKLKKNSVFKLCDTLCQEVVDKKAAVIHGSLKGSPQYELPGRAFLDTEAVIGTPIFINGEIKGTLTICSTEEKHNSENLKQYAQIAALVANKIGKILYDSQIKNILNKKIDELKRMEFVYSETQKMANVGGWEVDLISNSIFWSDEVYRIHEVPIGTALVLEEGINFYHSDYRDLISSHIDNAVNGNGGWDDQLKLISAEGNEIWVRAKGEAVMENGKAVKLRGTFQNIDKQKKDELIQQQQQQDLKLFMEALPDLYVRCDANYKVLSVKRGDSFIAIVDTDELFGQSLEDRLPEKAFRYIKPLIDQAIHQKTPAQTEFEIVKNGVLKINEARFIPSIEGQAIGLLRDITNLRTRELELAKLNEELQRSNKELEEFAYIASHDLQEPLRKVTAFGDRLKLREKDNLSEKGNQYIDIMTKSTNRMQTLIDDLLSYSRVMGVQKKLQEVDLNYVLQGIHQDFELILEELQGELIVKSLPTIIGNQVSIHQLFHNLIGNAIKFRQNDKSPKIEIYSEENQDDFYIFVKDNGIGIDKQYADLIFQPFKRLHSKNEYKGTGIGLAICNKIVQQLGGKISALGELNEGTTFKILIPKKIISE